MGLRFLQGSRSVCERRSSILHRTLDHLACSNAFKSVKRARKFTRMCSTMGVHGGDALGPDLFIMSL